MSRKERHLKQLKKHKNKLLAEESRNELVVPSEPVESSQGAHLPPTLVDMRTDTLKKPPRPPI